MTIFSTNSPLAPGYMYHSAGTFTVTLTVVDDKGATGTQVQTVTVSPTAPVNQPPSASFVWTATNLKVNFDGSASADTDGTIVRWDWDMQQSTFTSTTSPLAPGYVYNAAGTYTVKLTVTDDKGATGTTSKQVTVSAAPAPTPAPTGLGDAGGNGVLPSGAGVTSWASLSGATFSARTSAAGAANVCALPTGTYTFSDFSINGGGTSPTQFFFGAKIDSKGIVGPGSNYVTVQMVANSSTKSYDVPTQGTYLSNQLQYIFITTANATVDGVKILGTAQGHLYNGLRFDHVASPTLSNSTIAAIPGDAGSPPGETFGVNFQGCTGTVTVTNVTGDGGGVSAAMLGSNNSGATYNITNLYTHDHPYSAGWASWEHTGTMNFYNFVMRKGARAFNAERLVGVVNFYDPLWDEPMAGHSDVNPTYEAGWTGGKLKFYFSSTAAWNSFVAPRATKKITAITNQLAVDNGLKRSTAIEVYIGNTLQTQSNYVAWSGAGAGT